jgi:hypothetical protein
VNARLAGVAEWLSVLPVKTDLGRDQDAIATSAFGQCLANDLLGAAEALGWRGIDQGDAMIEGLMNGADRLRLVRSAPHPSAHRPGAERDARRLERCARNVDELNSRF